MHSHAPNPNAKSTSNNVKEEREFELLFCRGAVVSTNTATLGGDYEVLTSKSNKNKYKAPLTGIVLKTKTGECSVEWVDAINELMQYLDKDKPPGSEQALTSEKEDFLVI